MRIARFASVVFSVLKQNPGTTFCIALWIAPSIFRSIYSLYSLAKRNVIWLTSRPGSGRSEPYAGPSRVAPPVSGPQRGSDPMGRPRFSGREVGGPLGAPPPDSWWPLFSFCGVWGRDLSRINRHALHRNPWAFLRLLTADSIIRFEGEAAIGEGVRREFVGLVAEALLQDRTHFADAVDGFILPVCGSLSAEQRRDFQSFGRFLVFAKSNSAVIGPLFPEKFFHGLFAAFFGEEDGIVRAFLRSDRTYARYTALCDKGVWDESDRRIAGELGATNSRELVACLRDYVPLEALKAIASGLVSDGSLRSCTPRKLERQIQGEFSCAGVFALCDFFGVAEFRRRWLREWILESEENARKFLVFVTGNFAYGPRGRITVQEGSVFLPTASTCSRTITIPRVNENTQFLNRMGRAVVETTAMLRA